MTQLGGLDDLRDLYQEVILDHGRRPRRAQRLDTFDHTARGDNPMCGDRIQIWVKMDADKIGRVGFEARGCAISVAAADLMAEAVQNRNLADTRVLFDAFRTLVQTGTRPDCGCEDLAGSLELLAPLSGVHEYPSRVKCATLAWHALIAALDGSEEARDG